jgi:predicted aspartyl protease
VKTCTAPRTLTRRQALLALVGAALAPRVGAGTGTAESTELPAETSPDAPLYVAPTTADRTGRVMVPVLLNGQGPFRFIVDTGASRSALSPKLADRLGLVPSLDHPLGLQGTTGSSVSPSVLIEHFQTGDMTLLGHRLPVIAQEVLADADGLLGVEALEGMRMLVDFQLRQITIARHRSRHMAGNWYRVPVNFRFGRLMVAEGRIGRVPVKAVIDTGAERTLGNLALRRALNLDHAARQEHTESQVIGATAEQQAANTIRSPTILIGQTALVDVDVTYADLNVFQLWGLVDQPALIVGMDVLGTVRALLFDYRRRELMIRLDGALPVRLNPY